MTFERVIAELSTLHRNNNIKLKVIKKLVLRWRFIKGTLAYNERSALLALSRRVGHIRQEVS